jgi:hypothetical protein
MAMTKAERVAMDKLAGDLRLAKALSWPTERPTLLDRQTALALSPTGIVRAWWFNYHVGQVGEGCFDSVHHSRHRADKTDSQGNGGPWFPTKRDALLALRQAATEDCAKRLARIDAMIEEAA